MTNRITAPIASERNFTVMLFGRAKLIQKPDGRLELKNATREEEVEAKEYISLFMHEAIVSFGE